MAKSKNTALLVGISDYSAPLHKLPGVAADVREMAKILYSDAGAFAKAGTGILYDEKATKSAIEAAVLETFISGSNDTVFAYFAGHGEVENEEYYFIAHDTKINALSTTGVPLKWIKQQFDNCKSQQVLLWLDFCRSGGILKRGTPEDHNTAIARAISVVKGKGRIIFAACTPEQSAYEDPHGHGYFTGALLRGLRGEAERFGEITATGLFEFIDMEIGSSRQTPVFSGEMTGRIVLVNRGKRKIEEIPAPAVHQPQAVSESTAVPEEHWVLLADKFLDARAVRRASDGNFLVDIFSNEDERDALIQSLRPQSRYGSSAPIPFAFKNDALDVSVKEVTSDSEVGGQLWKLTLKPTEDGNRGFATEMTIVENHHPYTPGEIAELRARLLLLNEKRPKATGFHDLSLLTNAIERPAGWNKPLFCVVREIYSSHKERPELWQHLAKLASIYFLKATGTIEYVLNLSIGEAKDGKAAVTFKGKRRREYTNVEPTIISFTGECDLT
jgi:uncharacterized caspase-like protein